MELEAKVFDTARLKSWRESLLSNRKKLVVTNGCFDLLHLGHVAYLHEARKLGDALLIGLNSDEAVRKLKGTGRPINNQNDRALVLAGLASVSAVYVFEGTSATSFLSSVCPEIYVKGGDYTVDQLPADERRVVQEGGGLIHVLKLIPGRSTTSLVERISS
jgi:rfaE bifunctional protein nucleotidyltransferase chain/domain